MGAILLILYYVCKIINSCSNVTKQTKEYTDKVNSTVAMASLGDISFNKQIGPMFYLIKIVAAVG